ncbi:MAG: division/cell wall cluster transcriptional repressor MraZ [Patescibacteria group bacterium]
MFIGEYVHSLDTKRRLAIPAKFRGELGKRAVLTRGPDRCLALYPMVEWEKVASKIAELPTGQKDARSFARFFLAGASEVEVDSLGRILVPDFLKDHAELGEEVVVTGVFRRLEVWNKERWENYKKEIEGEADSLAEKLGEIGAY